MPTVTWDHVHLRSPDPEATAAWLERILGGEIIRRLQMDSDLRKQPIEQVVGDLIDDEGGPLLSHGESEAEQRAFDATCRKFARFLAAAESSRDSGQNAQLTTNRVNH